jgi:sulfatase maturation enzyme AslB (radical SAM superfamily)
VDEKLMTKTYCSLPWTHLANEANGILRACCIASEKITGDDGVPLKLQTSSVNEIFHGPYMKKLRKQFRDGEKPQTCNICWSDEANGKTSKRMIYNKMADDHGRVIDYDAEPGLPDDWQLILNNTCNLKCRTCHPHASSKWIKEAIDRNISFDPIGSQKIISNDSAFWNTRDEWMPHVRSLEFMGGEPFFMKEFATVLDEFIDKGYAKNVRIRMSSNCTQRPEKLIERIIDNFAGMAIGLSVDGVGKRFEYLRHPGNWSLAASNLEYFTNLRNSLDDRMKFDFGITHTVSLHNIYYIHELHEYLDTLGIEDTVWHNLVYFPPWYQVSILPRAAKDVICNHLRSKVWREQTLAAVTPLMNHMENSEYDEYLMKRAVKEIKEGDAYRKEDFAATFPEMYKLIEDHWV